MAMRQNYHISFLQFILIRQMAVLLRSLLSEVHSANQ